MIPIIGILSCGFSDDRQFVTDAYVQAVLAAGGLPFILPIFPPDAPASLLVPCLECCDAFLFPGGGDFTPLLFGETPSGQTGRTSLDLDRFQLQFAAAALDTGKPILGICRGMQLMNMALGGALFQDLSQQEGRPFCHMQNTRSRSEASHTVLLEPGCLLQEITGQSSLDVNSYHHQSIRLPGQNVQICGRASDGTAEAIEVLSHPFAVGVQWHPESMYSSSLEMRKLFYCFIHF